MRECSEVGEARHYPEFVERDLVTESQSSNDNCQTGNKLLVTQNFYVSSNSAGTSDLII